MSFYRIASCVLAERVTIQNWRNLVVASQVKQDPKVIETQAAFDVDEDNFIYVRVRAVSAGEYHGPNGNGDYFPEQELERSYKTFVRRGNYMNHDSDSVDKAVGIILDAKYWNTADTKYVECLLAVDKSELIADKIAKGIATDVSMGAIVDQCECNVCHKVATNESEYCDHLKTSMGKVLSDGRKVYAINHGVNFYELSWVTVGADKDAKMLERIASKQEQPFNKFQKLADSYQGVKEATPFEPEQPKEKPEDKKEDKPKDSKKEPQELESVVEKIVDSEVKKELEKDLAVKVRDALKKLQPKQKLDKEVTDEEIMKAVQIELAKKIKPDLPIASALHQIVNSTLQDLESKEDKPLDLGDGYSVVESGKVAGKRVVQLLDRGKPTGLFAEAQDSTMSYRKAFSIKTTETIEQPELDSLKNKPEDIAVQGKMTIKYVPGVTLDKCMFIARKGHLEARQSATNILNEQTQKAIIASETKKTAAGKVEYGVGDYDSTDGKIDTKFEMGKDPAEPGKVVSKVPSGKAEEGVGDYDSTGGKIDHEMTMGKDPVEPSKVVSKYASLVGGKVVKLAEDEKTGIVEATVEGGSIARLKQLWGTDLKLVSPEVEKPVETVTAPVVTEPAVVASTEKTAAKKEAKITGTPGGWAKETTTPVEQDTRDLTKTLLARETPAPLPGTGPQGSRGSEEIRYWGGLGKGNLSEGGEEGWARKVASLQSKMAEQTGVITEKEAEIKFLKAALEKTKKAQEDEKKTTLVTAIMDRMSEAGSLEADPGEILELKDKGMEHELAVAKATANIRDRQKRDLAALDIAALEKMKDVINRYSAVENNRTVETENPKSVDIPIVGSEESGLLPEQKLASAWGL